MILANEPAHGCNFRHTRNGFELKTEIPVLQAAQFGKAVAVGAVNDGIFIDPAGSGSVRSNHGRHIFRQDTLELLDVFEYAGARPIKVRAVFKNHEDVGITKHGLRADSLHVGSSEESGDDGIGNLVFDDVGRLTFPGNVNDDLNVGNVWQSIKGNVFERPDSGEEKQECSCENQEAIVRAPVNDAGDHGYMPPCACKLSCFVARTAPFLLAVTVTFHVPPLSSVNWPS